MRKILLLAFMLMFLSIWAITKDNFIISTSISYLIPIDKNFSEIYGNKILLPELKTRYLIYKGLYIWGECGIVSVNGKTKPYFSENAKMNCYIITAGAGYTFKLTGHMDLSLGAGLPYVIYEEKAIGEVVNGSALGFRIDGELRFRIWKSAFFEFAGSYLNASDTINGISFNLGGVGGAVGFGLIL